MAGVHARSLRRRPKVYAAVNEMEFQPCRRAQWARPASSSSVSRSAVQSRQRNSSGSTGSVVRSLNIPPEGRFLCSFYGSSAAER